MIMIRYANRPEFHHVSSDARYVSCPETAVDDRRDLYVSGYVNREPQFRRVTEPRHFVIAIPVKTISQWGPMDRVIFIESAEKNPSGGGYLWKWAEAFTDAETRLITFLRSLIPAAGSEIRLSTIQSAELRSACSSSSDESLARAAEDVFSIQDEFELDHGSTKVRQLARSYIRSLGPNADRS